MPHIAPEVRSKLTHDIECLLEWNLTAGEINYVLTRMLLNYARRNGIKYDTLKDVDGILGTASKEFYRCVTAKYEDKKIVENGSAYEDFP